MNQITLEELELRNYDYKNISNHKLVGGLCIKCGCDYSYSAVKKFLLNRIKHLEKKYLWNSCRKCWLIIQTSENKEWIEKNRASQLIAQNKPEQKERNAKAVSKSWNENRKLKASEHLKDRWKNDEQFKTKAISNINWTNKNDGRYEEIMRKSLGRGGLRGVYENIRYDSALELSYIIWCKDNNINIKRYDLEFIEYIDENNKKRNYIPDFIINNDTIVEIKGLGLYYIKNFKRNEIKIKVLKDWCFSKNINFRLLLSTDKILVKNYNKARKIHHENKKQENNSL